MTATWCLEVPYRNGGGHTTQAKQSNLQNDHTLLGPSADKTAPILREVHFLIEYSLVKQESKDIYRSFCVLEGPGRAAPAVAIQTTG